MVKCRHIKGGLTQENKTGNTEGTKLNSKTKTKL